MYNTWPITHEMNVAGYVADAACCVSPLLSALSAKSAERNIGHGTIVGSAIPASFGAFLSTREMATGVGTASTGEGRTPRLPRLGMLQQLAQQTEQRWQESGPQLSSELDRSTGFNPGNRSMDAKLADLLKGRGGDLAH